MGCKPCGATFEFKCSEHGQVVVKFVYVGHRPHSIRVVIDGKSKSIDNQQGRYKPCATHAQEAIGHVLHKPPKNPFEEQRRERPKPPPPAKIKPSLKLVSEE